MSALLAAGDTLEDVERELFASAQQQTVVTEDSALQEMLDSPLDRWRVFLHPTQRDLVSRKTSGPFRVLGGAGTGKTVVAMHRAKYLAGHVCTADTEQVLLTGRIFDDGSQCGRSVE